MQKVLIVVQTVEVICTLRFRRKAMKKTSKKVESKKSGKDWTPIVCRIEHDFSYLLDSPEEVARKLLWTWWTHQKLNLRMQVTQVYRGNVTLWDEDMRFRWTSTDEQFKKEFWRMEQ